jgi:hypothetical protein
MGLLPSEASEICSLTQHLAANSDGIVVWYWHTHSCVLIMGDLRSVCLPCEVALGNPV